VSYIVTFCHIN